MPLWKALIRGYEGSTVSITSVAFVSEHTRKMPLQPTHSARPNAMIAGLQEATQVLMDNLNILGPMVAGSALKVHV
jgi:hypothetical protein